MSIEGTEMLELGVFFRQQFYNYARLGTMNIPVHVRNASISDQKFSDLFTFNPSCPT